MGGFLGGFGGAAGDFGEARRKELFTHQENALRLWQDRQAQLAASLERAAAIHPGPEGDRIRNMQMEVHGLEPGTPLDKYNSQFSKLYDEARQRVAERAAAKAREIPAITPPNVINSSPWAATIAGNAARNAISPSLPSPMGQMIAGAPPAAQAPTSPVAPSAQGGAASAPAAFPKPAASPEPAPVSEPVPAVSAPAPPIPPVGPSLDFQRSVDWANAGGSLDPLSAALVSPQAGLITAQQKLQMVEPYISQLPPQLQGIVRAEILAGGSGMNGLMATMFAAPQKHFVDAGSMSPAEKQAAGIPPDASGKYTVYWDRFRNPVGAEPGWAGSITTTNTEGIQGKQSVNDALAHGITAVGGGPSVAPTTLAPVNTGIDASGHNIYESKGKIIKDLAGGGTRTGAGVNPAVLPTTGTEIRTIQTVDTEGRPVTQLVPVQVSHQKNLPNAKTGKIPPVGGGVAGATPGAPQQFLKPLTSATQGMKEAAPKVLDLIDRVEGQIDREQNELGPAAGRWSEFMAGTVGAPNPEFTELRTNIGLLQTLLMRMHVGARGGQQMMAHFQGLLDSGKQSPENLHAALREIRAYANDVLSEGPAQIKARPEIPPVGMNSGPVVLKSKADYDALPRGAAYIDSDGKTYHKK